ncbi:MAG: ABC-type sugar transport system, ATPase component [Propionibacteriaceae bacterium]|nr:ABC-type sugar transport system, ATPase component [Propionibacteriaceae bacterium]
MGQDHPLGTAGRSAGAVVDQPSPVMPAGSVIVDVTGVTKSYGGVHALRGVDFQLRAGEVHALLGQNGAGKSTLIKILAGVTPPSEGRIEVLGQEVSFSSPHDSLKAGIGVVYQDLSLVPSMTVVDNLYLGREPMRFGTVDRRAMMDGAKAFLERYDFPLDLKARVGDIPFAYRQMTEIAKALMGNVRVLILDEPTSALSESEEEVLFSAVDRVVKQGVGVIHVTHRLREVFAFCNRVTVFRDGLNVGAFDTAETDMPSLVSVIVGPKASIADELMAMEGDAEADSTAEVDVDDDHHGKVRTDQTPALELRDIHNSALHGVSLTVNPGEIVGLAGVVGAGRTEILETIFGLRKVQTGELLINGEARRLRSSVDAIRLGIGLVPEDRHEQGLVLEHSIDKNLAMPILKQLTRLGAFRRRNSWRRSREIMKNLSVKATNAATTLASLSGGNQQKVVFGRWVEPRCSVLLLDEPTVGVDVGAREEIYQVTRDAAAQGTGVLVASSDLDELLLLCERIYVVSSGATGESIDRAAIPSGEAIHHLVAQG